MCLVYQVKTSCFFSTHQFSHDCIENMNLLMTCIRREIKGTEFKLKYNFIDFVELFSKQLDECKVKI
ncbi:hypothetical protein ABTN65_19055, partial [Acinetobacter baumannii]